MFEGWTGPSWFGGGAGVERLQRRGALFQEGVMTIDAFHTFRISIIVLIHAIIITGFVLIFAPSGLSVYVSLSL